MYLCDGDVLFTPGEGKKGAVYACVSEAEALLTLAAGREESAAGGAVGGCHVAEPSAGAAVGDASAGASVADASAGAAVADASAGAPVAEAPAPAALEEPAVSRIRARRRAFRNLAGAAVRRALPGRRSGLDFAFSPAPGVVPRAAALAPRRRRAVGGVPPPAVGRRRCRRRCRRRRRRRQVAALGDGGGARLLTRSAGIKEKKKKNVGKKHPDKSSQRGAGRTPRCTSLTPNRFPAEQGAFLTCSRLPRLYPPPPPPPSPGCTACPPAARGPRNPRGEDGPQGHQRDKTDHRYGARGGYQGGRGRQFDRHSGGHRESERKASQGWGDPTENPDDVANQSGAAAAVSGAESDPRAALADPADKAAANTPAEDPEAAARAAELRRLREEEEKQKTLDEYLAEKATCSVALPEARKANEGADVTQWKDAVLLKNDDEQVLFAGKHVVLGCSLGPRFSCRTLLLSRASLVPTTQESTGKSRNRKERNKAVVDIKQQFAPRPRPERTTDNFGRRDRGQFRPNEGAGRGRGGDQRPSRPTGDRNLNVGDECAFPTLR
ncbi:MAG: hypothetical protein BJ554DRAFT_2178 [Olpidium bornovanus]|uniref:Hyaluronan/mRNA-binding protein domain-containing protein n=1 Tax=Olpidium bornovanus TaxID=278681 RepID=A0A8H8DGI1_9FUNG|nr:MAG: hypothetical protein BJ554DRAFT_2178 [Olpidium bornovanus]